MCVPTPPKMPETPPPPPPPLQAGKVSVRKKVDKLKARKKLTLSRS